MPHQPRFARHQSSAVAAHDGPASGAGDGSLDARLVGESAAIRELRTLVERLGQTDVTVLIQGESGTGKALVARSLHRLSDRRERPFLPIACGALRPDFFPEELSTDALVRKSAGSGDGPLDAAGGGTVVLEEIAEASPDAQLQLLRSLQEQELQLDADSGKERASARIIATTRRDLHAEVAAGWFREDLYYRLRVVPLVLPPLRDRQEDIPLLAGLFLERAAARHGCPGARLTERALAALCSHPWPGNVRELMHVIEAVVLLSGSRTIDAAALEPLLVKAAGGEGAAGEPGSAGEVALRSGSRHRVPSGFERVAQDLSSEELPTFSEARKDFERKYLMEVLRRASGNVTLAARLAGRHRTDFYDLLRRHKLRREDFVPE